MSLKSVFVVLVSVISLTAFGQTHEERLKATTNYLAETKKQLEEERRQIEKINDTKKSLALKVDNLNRSLKAQSEVIATLNSEAVKISREIKKLDNENKKLSNEIAKIKNSIETSNIYLIDNVNYVNAKLILFTKESRDSLKNMELLENINSILMKKADEIKEKSIELEKVKAETTQKLRDTEHLKRVREGVVKEYNNEKVKLNQLAAVMEQDKESKREYIKLLNTKRSEFENQLTKIRKQIEEAKKQEKAAAADNSVFGKLKGNLNWPIEGTVIEHFGPKKIDGFKGTINNNGLKIKPAKNSDVKVVEEGTVRYIDNIRGFGNIIIIGHAGSYYTLYANMAGVSVQTGEKVKAAQVIGVVSVDLPTDASYLYFEIRKGNQAVNPIDWLKPMRR